MAISITGTRHSRLWIVLSHLNYRAEKWPCRPKAGASIARQWPLGTLRRARFRLHKFSQSILIKLRYHLIRIKLIRQSSIRPISKWQPHCMISKVRMLKQSMSRRGLRSWLMRYGKARVEACLWKWSFRCKRHLQKLRTTLQHDSTIIIGEWTLWIINRLEVTEMMFYYIINIKEKLVKEKRTRSKFSRSREKRLTSRSSHRPRWSLTLLKRPLMIARLQFR